MEGETKDKQLGQSLLGETVLRVQHYGGTIRRSE